MIQQDQQSLNTDGYTTSASSSSSSVASCLTESTFGTTFNKQQQGGTNSRRVTCLWYDETHMKYMLQESEEEIGGFKNEENDERLISEFAKAYRDVTQSWRLNYSALIEYYKIYNHTNIQKELIFVCSRSFATENNCEIGTRLDLGRWLEKQKRLILSQNPYLRARLRPEREQLLQQLIDQGMYLILFIKINNYKKSRIIYSFYLYMFDYIGILHWERNL